MKSCVVEIFVKYYGLYDSYWSRVFEMKNNTGWYHFPQWASFVKAILTLFHRNAALEQGFSINKAIIDAHETRVGEDIIIALRRVKHRLFQVGSIVHFEITRPLIKSVKLSRCIVDKPKSATWEGFSWIKIILLKSGWWNLHRIRRPKFPPPPEILGFLFWQESMKVSFYICQESLFRNAIFLPKSTIPS